MDLPYLGLDELDKKKFSDEVNVVFHVAATVRFNEEIRDAANLNTLGTERIMDLCSSMINLKVTKKKPRQMFYIKKTLQMPYLIFFIEYCSCFNRL